MFPWTSPLLLNGRHVLTARPVPQQWVFGGVDLETRDCFLVLVPNRAAATLEAAVQQYVLPGTEPWTDMWKGYSNLENMLYLGYKHQAANHSVEYVRADGVHTNDIESLWCDAKRKFKAMNGCSLRSNIPSYLDEWMWKRKFGDCERFDACVAAIPFTR